MRLTKRIVDGLEEPRSVVMDTECPGFGVRVASDGHGKTFIVSYYLPTGQRRRNEVVCFFGQHTVEQARDMARRKLAAVELGVTPLTRPASVPAGPTFGDLLKAFAEYASRRRARTRVEDESRVRRYLADWDSRPAADITQRDVMQLARAIGEQPCNREKGCRHGGPGRCQGHPVQANRVAQLVRRIYSLAEDIGLLPRGSNPAQHLTRFLYREHKRHDRSAAPEEVRRLVPAIWQVQNPVVRALFWTLLLTGLRRGEASQLRWAEVNLQTSEQVLLGRRKLPGQCLLVPETKADRPLTLPLSEPLRDLLQTLPCSGEWVFTGEHGKPLTCIDKHWQRVRRRADCPELTLHDLRATVATWLDRAGVPERTIKAVLNHAPSRDVTERYTDAPAIEIMRRALEDHGAAVLEAAAVPSGAALVWPYDHEIIQFPGDRKTR